MVSVSIINDILKLLEQKLIVHEGVKKLGRVATDLVVFEGFEEVHIELRYEVVVGFVFGQDCPRNY